MMRHSICAAAFVATLATAGAAHAQTTPLPLNGRPVPCSGNGAITGVTTICAAPTGTRVFWEITVTAATVSDSAGNALYCTDNNTTPTATNWTYAISVGAWIYSAPNFVSTYPLQCTVPSGGSTTVVAGAVQAGAP